METHVAVALKQCVGLFHSTLPTISFSLQLCFQLTTGRATAPVRMEAKVEDFLADEAQPIASEDFLV